jgi:hypothetical protein
MSVTTHPAPARTDESDPAVTIGATGVRRLGLALTTGALAWSGAMFAFGTNPQESGRMAITDLTGLAFQLGVFALLTVQLKTRATGTSRAAVALLKVEYALLGLASIWSLIHGAIPALRDAPWLAVLDLFWPLSMLGMFIIGVKLFFARRWHGAARVWPLIAETWAVVTVPCFILLGESVSDIVGPSHLVIGYAALGVVLAARPQLTGAR